MVQNRQKFIAIRPEIAFIEGNKSQCPKSTIAYNGKTPMYFFAQLCSQNNQSDNFKVFRAFESSIKAFDKIFGNHVFLMNTALLKFRVFALISEVCEMGENFRLQNGLNLLCRV